MSTSKGKKRPSSEAKSDSVELNSKRPKVASKVIKKKENKNEIMFEGTNLLDLKGATLTRYARKVARTLWSDPDSLWYRRIVDPFEPSSANPIARPQFRGPTNMMKIQLLKDAIKEKFKIKPSEWEKQWQIAKESVNTIGWSRKNYKGNQPKTQLIWVRQSQIPGYKAKKSK